LSSAQENLILTLLENQQFGGPSSVTVNVDDGLQGPRGTFILLSNGDPNNPLTSIVNSYPDLSGGTGLVPADPDRYDICVGLNPFDSSYLTAYMYQDGAQGTKWYEVFRLAPEGFPGNLPLTFSAGQANLVVAAQAPTVLSSQIASASLSQPFNLDLYLVALAASLQPLLSFNFSVIGEKPIASSIFSTPSAPAPIVISYSDPGTSTFQANLQSGSREVALLDGNTSSLIIGQKIFKQSGSGAFSSSGVVITSILSDKSFTVSGDHQTSGNVAFSAASPSISLFYTISAQEASYSGDNVTWGPVSGSRIVHLLVTIAQP